MTANRPKDTGPLTWNVPIVDARSGKPSPEFQRRWEQQRANNGLIQSVQTGNGVPTGTPNDGDGYVDISVDPHVLYVGVDGVWEKVGVYAFTELSDVPHTYTASAGYLVRVNASVDGLRFDSLTNTIDQAIGSTRGSLLERGASGWTLLPPGTATYLLQTNGAGADPTWVVPPSSLPSIANNTLLANTSGITAVPIATTVTALVDSAISSTQGSILYRSATAWVALGPGTSGNFLKTNGAGANPAWSAVTAGTVTSVTSTNGDLTVATGTTTPVLTVVSAPKWSTGRTITLTGDTTGVSGSFDGSGNLSFATTGVQATKWTTARTLSFTGDVTGSGSVDGSASVATALTLANSGVSAGTYINATITVDAKGRVTVASAGTGVTTTGSPASGNLTKFSGANTVTNGDLTGVVTTSGTLATTAANPFQIGTPYIHTGSGDPSVTTDPKGSIWIDGALPSLWQQKVPAGSVPARVQEKAGVGSYALTLTTTPTPGNWIIAVGTGSDSLPAANTGWTSFDSWNQVSSEPYRRAVYRQVQAGDTTAITPLTSSATYKGVVAIEITNLGNTWSVLFQQDQNNQHSVGVGAGSDSVTTTATTSAANSLALNFVGFWQAGSVNPASCTMSGSSWTNTTSALSATTTGIGVAGGSAAFVSNSSTVTGTGAGNFGGGVFSAGIYDVVVIVQPDTATQGWQKISQLSLYKNAGSSLETNPLSLNVSSGLTLSTDGVGNMTLVIAAAGVAYAMIQNISATSRVLGRKTAGAGSTEELQATDVLDFIGSTRGMVLYRGASGWSVLATGTSGYVLSTNGAGADPSWIAQTGGGGGGTVTSVATDTTYLGGNTITSTGTVSFSDMSAASVSMIAYMLYGGF